MLSKIIEDNKDHEFEIPINRKINMKFQLNFYQSSYHSCQFLALNTGNREFYETLYKRQGDKGKTQGKKAIVINRTTITMY